jgi:hypothetical protein
MKRSLFPAAFLKTVSSCASRENGEVAPVGHLPEGRAMDKKPTKENASITISLSAFCFAFAACSVLSCRLNACP